MMTLVVKTLVKTLVVKLGKVAGFVVHRVLAMPIRAI
jgi:hypothetical protein